MLMVGNGLNPAVLGVRMVDEGFGVRTSGVVMACYFAGFLLGPLVVVRMLSAVGHIRVFASLASIASCAVLVHFVWVAPVSWGVLRFVFGFCMAGLFVVVESWLNDASTPTHPGPHARRVHDRVDGRPGDRAAPHRHRRPQRTDPLRRCLDPRVDVVRPDGAGRHDRCATGTGGADDWVCASCSGRARPGASGCCLTGASHGIVFGLGAVYATGAGLRSGHDRRVRRAPAIGALLFQWPIGWASDRLPRRGVIFVVAVAAAATALLLAVTPEDSAARRAR